MGRVDETVVPEDAVVVRPGVGMNIDPKALDPAAEYGIADDSQNDFSLCMSATKRPTGADR